jgi:hypothetical protein
VPPARLAMVRRLQAYLGVSAGEAGELSVMARRWQLGLECLDAPGPPFSQGAVGECRGRLRRTERARRLWERTVEGARRSQAFAPRKGPQTLRGALDARALQGAGRVEDTTNLLGHAARKVVLCVAVLSGCTAGAVAQPAGIPVRLAPRVKAGLARGGSDPQAPTAALQPLAEQGQALERGGSAGCLKP